LPAANVVVIEQAQRMPHWRHLYVEPGDLLLLVRIKNKSNQKVLRETVDVWFAPGSAATRGHVDDGADYQLDCQVASAPQNARMIRWAL